MVDIKDEYYGSEPESAGDDLAHVHETENAPYLTSTIITQPKHLDVVGAAPWFKGTGIPKQLARVDRASDGFAVTNPLNIPDSGQWQLFTTSDKKFSQGAHEVYPAGNRSGGITILVLFAPLITGPTITQTAGKVTITGDTGIPGFDVDVAVRLYRAGTNGELLGGGWISRTGTWSIPVTLPGGSHGIVAKQFYAGKYSAPSLQFKVEVMGIPSIDTPGQNEVVDVVTTVTGRGHDNATVSIFRDLTNESLGTVTPGDGGSWTKSVTLSPGSFSIVVSQKKGDAETARSGPRSLKVRPPQLTAVTTTLPNNTVRFSGAGYNGATVEITKVSGPGGQSLGPVTVVNNAWHVEATNWPPGQYSFSATQKVPDNNGGWIVSTPYAFTYKWELPAPADVRHTGDYTPIFSGSGYNGATVELFDRDRVTKVAPDAVVTGGGWSSQASTVWGPTLKREVHLRQRLGQVVSDGWVVLEVTIAPLAPVITRMIDNEYTPIFEGTCWVGAQVNLTFSDDLKVYPAVVQGGTWSYSRPTPFEIDITHIVTVKQRWADQDSPPTFLPFSVSRTLPTPVFTAPGVNEEVGRDLLVEGTDGVAGGQVQLKDVQFGPLLGKSAFLTMDGYWSVALRGLEFREYRIQAVQVMGSRESTATDVHVFKVVVLPPVIEVPASGGAIARTAIISGTGMPNARVDVYLEGDAEPLQRGLSVNSEGRWRSEAVTLEIGHKALWTRQIFEGLWSKDSPRQAFRVVPAAPLIETPVAVGQVGTQLVVSGFGYAGDEVAVAFSDEPDILLGRPALVRDDRTWSVAVELNRPGGNYSLIAVQSRGEFHSSPSEDRPVVLGAYMPSVDAPAPGRWVNDPVGFAGQGQTGVGVLVSWYNPERVLANEIVVTDQGWQSQTGVRLPPGGHWVRFKQVIHRDVSWTHSDWAESARFEVVSSPPESKL